MGKKLTNADGGKHFSSLAIIAKGLQDGKEKSIHCLNYVSTYVGVHMSERERGGG